MPRFLNRQQAVLTDSQHYTTKISQEQLSEAETTNTKLDTANTNLVNLKNQQDGVIGALNNTTIGDGTLGQRTYVYAHDTTAGQGRALKCDSAGRLECSVDALEVTADTINLNVDTLETLIGTTNTKLQSDLDFAGEPNSIGDGQNMKRVMNYGHDSSGGQQRPLKVDGDGHLHVECLTSALPTGGATEAKQDAGIVHLATIAGDTTSLDGKVTTCNTGAVVVSSSALPTGPATQPTLADAEAHLGNIDTGIDALESCVGTNTAAGPSKAVSIGGTYVDGSFREMKVDNIGKVIVDSPAGSDLCLRLDAIQNAVEVIDNAISGSEMQVDVVSMPTTAVTVAGGATEAKQDAGIVHLATIAGDTTSLDGKVTACNTGAVVVSSSALPSGASTSANQSTANGHLSAIETSLSNVATDNSILSMRVREDDAHVDRQYLMGVGVVRQDTLASLAGTDQDTTMLSVNADGALYNISPTANALLTTIAGDTTSLDGKVTACNTGAIAGSVTANAGTNLNTSALALESGGNLATIAGTVGFSKVNVNLASDAAGLATQVTAAVIAGDTTSIDGKITACDTGAVVVSSSALPSGASTAANQSTGNGHLSTIAGAVSGSEMQVDVVSMPTTTVTGTVTANLSATDNAVLDVIAGDTTSLDGKVTQGNDSTLTNAQQVLIYGKNGTGDLKPIHITNNGDVEVEIADFVKGQAAMAASFPVVISSDQSTVSTVGIKTYSTLTTVDAALAVNASSNNDSSIVSNTDYNSVYQLQVVCSDAAYTSWTADVYQSIDASNFYKTFEDLNNGPSGPQSKLLTVIDRPTTSWKINIQNTGASNKTFAIKYIRA